MKNMYAIENAMYYNKKKAEAVYAACRNFTAETVFLLQAAKFDCLHDLWSSMARAWSAPIETMEVYDDEVLEEWQRFVDEGLSGGTTDEENRG